MFDYEALVKDIVSSVSYFDDCDDDILTYLDAVYEEESRIKRMDEIYRSVFNENIFESVCTFRKPVDNDKPVLMFPVGPPLFPRIPWSDHQAWGKYFKWRKSHE